MPEHLHGFALRQSVATMTAALKVMVDMFEKSQGKETPLSDSRWAKDPLDVIADMADILRIARDNIVEQRMAQA